MSIFDNAYQWITGAAGSVSDLAGRVYHAISAVLHFILHLIDLVGSAWDWMVRGVDAIGAQMIAWVDQAYHTIRWILTQALPDAARWALGKAVTWARTAIKAAEKVASVALRAAIRAIDATIGREVRALLKLISDARKVINSVYHWVRNTGARVADLVLHPDRMAAWIAGAIVLPVTKWLVRKSAPIIVYLARNAATVMPQVAHTIEDALAKII